MHVLVTADTMSGAWTYTRELVTGLVTRGVRVTLVTFGEIPLPDQTAWMELLHGLEYRPTAFRLEWMDEAPKDLADSSEFLLGLVREIKPDLLHLHQFCHANLPFDIPRVVMAHGDLITWAQAVQGCSPRPTRWLKWYSDTVVRGITAADAVVVPSACMLDSLLHTYARPRRASVIYPGRNPIFFNPYIGKEDSVLSVGRLLDAGKQVFLLTQYAQPFSVCIVGAEQTVPLPRIPIRADVKVSTDQSCVAIRGPQTEAQLRALYSRAAVYAATARYEPLGMSALDAAFSRCAIVANDIPSFREVWGDAALYFRTNDASSLAATLRQLDSDRPLRRAYADRAYTRARERFTTKRMIDDYLELYRSLLAASSLAA
ncbi:MAG TPA: glycosyltransferase family 4 protein [Candidatus Sulfotelmatobacter sp.]|nr:glycosyltransferase family 4 protein [Candidatus Sulfotelmatobacter sp.]